MDKRRLYFACVVLLWGLASGCTWDAGWEHAPPQDAAQAAFPIEQAQRIFEQQVLRHAPSAASEGPRLSPTDFTPLWRGARFEANEYLYCYDVEISSDLGLAARVTVERRGKLGERLVAPVQKLIVARSRSDSTAYAYLLTLVPDWECHRRWRGVVGEIFSHAGDKSRFSGVAIYTTLSGQTVSVSRYDEDGLRGTAYLGDPRAANFSQALERARGLLDGVRLLGVTVTRGGGDGTEMIYENGEWIVNCTHCNNEGCEICTIVVDPNPCPWCGTWPCKCDDSPDPDPDPYDPPEDPHDPKPCPACAQYPCVCNGEPGQGGGSSGGGGSGGGSSGLSPDLDFSFIANPLFKNAFIRVTLKLPNTPILKALRDCYNSLYMIAQDNMLSGLPVLMTAQRNPLKITVYYDGGILASLSDIGRDIIVLHEMYHIYCFMSGYSDNALDHKMMILDPQYLSWLQMVFPGHPAEFYEMLRYAGTQTSLTYLLLSEDKKKELEQFFIDNGIYQ